MVFAMRQVRAEVYRREGYEIRVIGGRGGGWRDLYHAFLRLPWWAALAIIGGSYLVLNALFAALYLEVGGIANAGRGSFLDAFFFSIQTMGTIGYGAMYPASHAANGLVVAESVLGLWVIALTTGLVFARFSLTRARVAFSARAAVSPLDGVPTLMMRVGNERRRNEIVDATFRLVVMRTTRTAEGAVIYRTEDLPLVRDRAPALQRSWMVLHRIEPGTPLDGVTPEALAESEAELTLTVAGVDGTTLQPVHALHTWMAQSVVFGARLADVVTDVPDAMIIDLRRFHDLVPTAAAPGFPYRAKPPSPGGGEAAPSEEAAGR